MRNDNGTIERKYVILPIAAVLVGLLMGMISMVFTKHHALPIMCGRNGGLLVYPVRPFYCGNDDTNSVLPIVIAHNTGFILKQQTPFAEAVMRVQEWTIRVGETVLYKVYGTYLDSSLEAGLPLMCSQPPDYSRLYCPELDSRLGYRTPSGYWAASREWCGYSVVDDLRGFEYYWNPSFRDAVSKGSQSGWISRNTGDYALAVVRLTPTS